MKTPKYKGSFLKPTQQKHADKVFDFLRSTTKEPDWQSVAEKLAEALQSANKEMKQCLNFLTTEGYEDFTFDCFDKINSTLNEYKKLKQ